MKKLTTFLGLIGLVTVLFATVMTVHTTTGSQDFEISEITSITFGNSGEEPINMIYVAGGNFEMGDHFGEGDSDELPVHTVTLDDFYISETEVTHTAYIEFLNAYGVNSNGTWNDIELIHIGDGYCAIDYDDSFYFDGSSIATTEDCPVMEISWYGMRVFCNYKSEQEGLTPCYDLANWSCNFEANGYRLPTEAEWEYAARGGIHHVNDYEYAGTTDNLDDYAWYNSNSSNQTHPVGTKLPNQLGIYDMSGNAYEYCNDWYDSNYYDSSPENNPTGPTTGSEHVVRNASAISSNNHCRVNSRFGITPDYTMFFVSFRIVRR